MTSVSVKKDTHTHCKHVHMEHNKKEISHLLLHTISTIICDKYFINKYLSANYTFLTKVHSNPVDFFETFELLPLQLL